MGVDFDLERPLLSSHLQDSLNRRSEKMARVHQEEMEKAALRVQSESRSSGFNSSTWRFGDALTSF